MFEQYGRADLPNLIISAVSLVIIVVFVSLTISSSVAEGLKQSTVKLEATQVISPVKTLSQFIVPDNTWFPKKEILGVEQLKITAQSAFFIDADTGEVLYGQNAHQKLKIASLTKIMTAIVALEHRGLDDSYTVSKWAADIMPDKMNLRSGERLTLKELLSGLFLVSANDSAEVLAAQSVENRQQFILRMNEKARQLGMKETLFVNPTGLDNDDNHSFSLDGDQYSTAFDVALMSRYAIKQWPALLDITSQPEIHLAKTISHQVYDLDSVISLVKTDPEVKGFKTGYTDEANYTFVVVAQREGRTVIGVLLNAQNSRDDTQKLLDYSFNKLASK